MIDYKTLNDNLFNYLDGAKLEELKLIKSLNDIVLRNKFNQKILGYKEKMDLDYTASLAYTFLNI